jgi:hypothetical protein
VKAAFISTNFTTPLYILINTFYLSKYIVPVWSKSFPSNLSLTHHHDEDNHVSTIPPKDLTQTLLKYPHKSEKIETITRDHHRHHMKTLFAE